MYSDAKRIVHITDMTVRMSGMADIQVRNARSTAPVGAAKVTAPLLTFSPDSTKVSARIVDTVVSLAGATNLASVTVARWCVPPQR